ncbi:MAG: protoporphyrinogen oxidase HemJ [Rhodospirillaceae bacterium]|nr:protoporphyrinogen oxidase HemJ [Rhodospirillaceae bacterium]
MIEFSGTTFLWIKALHIISVIAWMAGLLYLPRLFVYHTDAAIGSQMSETFKVMERRLLRAIMNPAMLSSLLFGGLLLASSHTDWTEGWLHIKLLCVAGLLALHMMMAGWRRAFAEDRNAHPQKFFRYANEAPTLLMVAIVIMAVLRPF